MCSALVHSKVTWKIYHQVPRRVASGCEKGQPVCHGRQPGPSSSGHRLGCDFFLNTALFYCRLSVDIVQPAMSLLSVFGPNKVIVILQAQFGLHLAVGIVYWTAIGFITGLHDGIPRKNCFETACHNVRRFFHWESSSHCPLAISFLWL